MGTEQWSVTFRNSIGGWMLVSARKQGGRTLHGRDIPERVRTWALVDAKGRVTDPEVTEIVKQKSRDGHQATFKTREIKTREIKAPTLEKPRIVPVSVEDSASLTTHDGRDSVYWATGKARNGWYVSAMIDSETGSFVDDMYRDKGPYKSEADAYEAGLYSALDWMSDNSAHATKKDIAAHEREIKRLRSR